MNPMTCTPSETTDPTVAPTAPSAAPKRASSRSVQPVLDQLFQLYPHLFGAEFLPLKLGIFQELLACHPEHFERNALKAALGVHTRSTRYLQSVAAGKQRHDLAGTAVEPVAPEHVYLAMLELFRRRQGRTDDDLRPRFRAQLRAAFEASGLTRQEYLSRIPTKDADATALLEGALDERDQMLAKQEALRRAFEGSGKTPEEFAAMYGLHQHDVTAALARSKCVAEQPLATPGAQAQSAID